MRMRNRALDACRSTTGVLVVAILAVVVLLSAVYLIHLQGYATVERMILDPAVTMDEQILLGAVSHLGVLIWAAAAAVSLFTWTALRTSPQRPVLASFLLWAGVLSAILGLDDLFLIHDRVAPVYAGISESVIYAAYGSATALLLVHFRDALRQTELLLLLAAMSAFGLSVLADLLATALSLPGAPEEYLVEDGLKLLGVTLWALYLVRTAITLIRDLGVGAARTVRPPAS